MSFFGIQRMYVFLFCGAGVKSRSLPINGEHFTTKLVPRLLGFRRGRGRVLL